MALAPPLFESPKTDPSSDPTLLQPSMWNRMVALLKGLFDGADAHGSVLVRDTSDVTDGGAWVPSAAGVLTCAGPGSLPSFQPLAAGPPTAHHATHETGGTDAITALAGSVITSGTVPDARLSANVARTNLANTFAQAQTFNVSMAVGTNPAQSGAIRLPSSGALIWRNAANTGDVFGMQIDGGNACHIAETAAFCYFGTHIPYSDNASDIGGASTRYRTVSVGTSVNIGTNPAQSGAVRLANNQSISARNAANTTDITIVNINSSDNITFGDANTVNYFSGQRFSFSSTDFLWFSIGGVAFYWNASVFGPNTSGSADLGGPLYYQWRNIYVTSSVVNKVKAGTPTDADVVNPADGMMVLDSTANKIWVRLGGVWKGVVVA